MALEVRTGQRIQQGERYLKSWERMDHEGEHEEWEEKRV